MKVLPNSTTSLRGDIYRDGNEGLMPSHLIQDVPRGYCCLKTTGVSPKQFFHPKNEWP